MAKIITSEVDFDYKVVLVACKALCNFAIDNQKQLVKEDNLLKKLVFFTSYVGPENPNGPGPDELKIAALYSLKNLLYG